MGSPAESSQPAGPLEGDTIFVKHARLDPSTQQPATPQEIGPQDPLQETLPSTEIPNSPIDPNESFSTQVNEERPHATVIPSSLTPPPSTQVNISHNASQPGPSKRKFSASQQSTLCSPPATIQNIIRDRSTTSDFLPPAPQQVLEASADELRVMVQNAVAEQQKLKTEAAHFKLQYNLMALQADDDAKRAAVEHEMMRREVEALRNAEHTRQARKELDSASESVQAKYLQMKAWYEGALQDQEVLQRRLKTAKKVIKQREDEYNTLAEERDMLLNRIRENREHMQMLCSPGGIFHALAPKQRGVVVPSSQGQRGSQQQASRTQAHSRQGEHGLSALLQAMSQDNNSAPSTPMQSYRPPPRHVGKHSRNAQSMSSLPTTPMSRPVGRHVGLLPSVDLVPQTEPQRYTQRQFIPTTPKSERQRRRSRESTISADDNEELARQALESVAAAQSFTSQASHTSQSRNRNGQGEVYDSQASQAAAEMLRRDPRQSFEVADSRKSTSLPGAVEKSVRMQERLLSNHHNGDGDKRKFSGNHNSSEETRRDHESPAKKSRVVEPPLTESQKKFGLGIEYRE